MSAGNLRFIDCHPEPTDLLREVLEGLSRNPKSLPPKLFYDQRGSELFEEITRLPEYYLTRTEIDILEKHAGEIVQTLSNSPVIIELGSGSSSKIRILLDQIRQQATYVCVDISLQQLRSSAESLAQDYPRLSVIAMCADYSRGFPLPDSPDSARHTVFFPGSNLGNFTNEESNAFFRSVAQRLRKHDGMLLGVDRKKDPAVLHAAYNDRRGVTAEFNLNLLRRINRELGGNFDLEAFEHVAFYDAGKGRIEMHLRARRAQMVRIGEATFRFEPGETIHTENSYKYNQADLQRLVSGSGFEIERWWSDAREWFSVYSLRVY